jgi:peptidoglycan hydrolase CwlO-like protein
MYQQTIPLIIMLTAIFAGILLNNKNANEMKADFQREISRLDSKIDKVSASLHERLNVIDSDLRQFYHLNGKLEGRVDAMEKRLG